MRRSIRKWAAVCVVAWGATACVDQPDTQSTVEEVVAPTVSQEAPLFNQMQKEYVQYPVKVVVYPKNFTQTTPLTAAQINTPGGLADQIRAKINAHNTMMWNASNELLRPTFDGTVTVNESRVLSASDFTRGVLPDGGLNPYELTSAASNAILNNDFDGGMPLLVILPWDNGPLNQNPTSNWTYPNGLITMPDNFSTGVLNHEMMHMLERRFERVNQSIPGYQDRMVGADDLAISTVTGQSLHNCITTPDARESSTPTTPPDMRWFNPDSTKEELIENILTLDDRCNGTAYNWCVLYKGAGALGNWTWSSNLCDFTPPGSPSYFLSPGVAHSWIVSASMIDSNWLYTEWDSAVGSSTYNLKLELINGSGNVATTINKNSVTGGTDRPPNRYLYYHRSEICSALQSASQPAGTYTMRFRADPTSNTALGHRKTVSGSISCTYSINLFDSSLLPGHGGSGGSSGSVACGTGTVAVGLVGRSGPYVDRLGLACAAVNSDGTLGTAYDYGQMGGTGGTYFADLCPSGQMLVGIKGRSYSWHDQISGECANVKTWATSGSIGSTLPARGGTGGVAYTDRCPQGYAVGFLNMRAATYVDYVQGRCYKVALQ